MTSSSTSVMDDEKFEQIVSEHSSFVYNVAYRMMGNPDDADEVVQDTFLSAYRARERFRGDAQVTTWLYRIATNAALMRLRKNSRKKEIPTDPTGVSLYSTTDFLGAARFGATDGNSLTGTGVASAEAIEDDLFSALEQFRLFQNIKGKPLWNAAIIDAGLVIYFGVHNWQVFAKAFKRERTIETVAGTGVGTPSNTIMAMGLKIRLEPTSLIPTTNDDWFIFLEGSRKKAIFQQRRQELREASATFDNSDQVRETKLEYIQWDDRTGWGLNVSYQTIRIDN
ncbi:MAG: sigma-70 family RNA polymerase sigma factor [Chloroflexi bacterium]|nr:sigma-70 family RNA polymerase sigma factor [Chloroflexota bacterium]